MLVVRYALACSSDCVCSYSVPAVMADIWAPAARGYAVSFFCVCVFTGPVMGPVVGSLCVNFFRGYHYYIEIRY
jgi:MFS family permease